VRREDTTNFFSVASIDAHDGTTPGMISRCTDIVITFADGSKHTIVCYLASTADLLAAKHEDDS
jgi:hypothetical protein